MAGRSNVSHSACKFNGCIRSPRGGWEGKGVPSAKILKGLHNQPARYATLSSLQYVAVTRCNLTAFSFMEILNCCHRIRCGVGLAYPAARGNTL